MSNVEFWERLAKSQGLPDYASSAAVRLTTVPMTPAQFRLAALRYVEQEGEAATSGGLLYAINAGTVEIEEDDILAQAESLINLPASMLSQKQVALIEPLTTATFRYADAKAAWTDGITDEGPAREALIQLIDRMEDAR